MRPLIVTADPDLLDDLLRLAATAGVEVDVASDAGAARRCWRAAPLVVVDADLLPDLLRSRPARRGAVTVVGRDQDDASVWERAVDLGAERVVFLPDGEPWLVDALVDSGETREGLVVAVLGGRGGAGATTLAVALSLAAARRGDRALLVDGDPLGGGVDLVLGAEGAPGLRWPDLAGAQGRLPGAALSGALPEVDGLSLLSWDRGSTSPLRPEAVRAVLAAARRSWDVVVVDLPRAFDDATVAVLEACDTALLVVPSELRAVAAAGQVATRAAASTRDLRAVVRPTGVLGVRDVVLALGLPLACALRSEPRLRSALEDGLPPGRRPRSPLAQASGRLLDELRPAARGAA